jgi:hypothetical protein
MAASGREVGFPSITNRFWICGRLLSRTAVYRSDIHVILHIEVMRWRIEKRLAKASRVGEHDYRGLQAQISRYQRRGCSISEACCRFVADLREKRVLRRFVAEVLWGIPDSDPLRFAMIKLALASDEMKLKADYLSFCSDRRHIHNGELELFQQVLAAGTSEEQMTAIDGLAFVCCRTVRRAFINIMNDDRLPLEVRERAIEMLHLQSHRETLDACAEALRSRTVTLRFWAAYTLGNLGFSGTPLGAVAASALESVLGDPEVAPGWWSVGREAQALIPVLRGDSAEQQRLQAEISRILEDPNAPPEDRRWAECYTKE